MKRKSPPASVNEHSRKKWALKECRHKTKGNKMFDIIKDRTKILEFLKCYKEQQDLKSESLERCDAMTNRQEQLKARKEVKQITDTLEANRVTLSNQFEVEDILQASESGIVVGDMKEAVQNAGLCLWCQFLVEALQLWTKDNSWRLQDRASKAENQISLILDPKPWFRAAGISTTSSLPPCSYAWLRLGANPNTGQVSNSDYEDGTSHDTNNGAEDLDEPISGKNLRQPFICISLEPNILSRCLSGTTPFLKTDAIHPSQRYAVEAFNGSCDHVMIEDWLATCDKHVTCNEHWDTHLEKIISQGKAPFDDITLIDVRHRRLVNFKLSEITGKERFLTLSYVWGPGPHLYADGRQKCHEERVLPPEGDVPQTIEDAIWFTKGLEISFLWVDLFCINQNDEMIKRQQIETMDAIFAASWLTLVCVDGPRSDHGLGGVSNSLTQMKQPYIKVDAGFLMATYVHSRSDFEGNSEWDRRAWTLQERLLSRRCLFFADNYYSLLCKEQLFHHLIDMRSLDHDAVLNIDDSVSAMDGSSLDLDAKDFSFKQYAEFVSVYTRRTITDQRDIFNACRGSLSRITCSTGVEFHYGLPKDNREKKYLVDSLMWIEAHKRDYKSSRRPDLPSWSWLGWNVASRYPAWLLDNVSDISNSWDDNDRNTVGHSLASVNTSMDNMYIDNDHLASEQTLKEAEYLKLGPEMSVAVLQLDASICRFQVKPLRGKSEAEWCLLDGDQFLTNWIGINQDYQVSEFWFRWDQDQIRSVKRKMHWIHLILLRRVWLRRGLHVSDGNEQHEVVSALAAVQEFEGPYRRLGCVLLTIDQWRHGKPESDRVVTLI